MIDFSKITAAVETMLKSGLNDYIIVRNEPRNMDPSVASEGKGWIGVYRGKLEYISRTMGNMPWGAIVEIIVEVQAASMRSGEDCEDRLQKAEKEVMDLLTADKKLGNTVDMTTGYAIEYSINADVETYHQAAIITLKAEVRS